MNKIQSFADVAKISRASQAGRLEYSNIQETSKIAAKQQRFGGQEYFTNLAPIGLNPARAIT